MDLRHLAHLVALDDERHFARAAERVNLSQSAFSRSIKVLEDEAGCALFEREPGEVRPTAAGSFLTARARSLLFDARALEHDFSQFQQARLGAIAFGVGPFAGATLIPELVSELRSALPDVTMRIEVSNWRVLFERLLAEDLEFFLADVRELPRDGRIDTVALGHQQGGFYVRRGHPIAGCACSLADLLGFGLLSVSLPSEAKRFLLSHVGVAANTPLALECDDFNLLKSVALRTDSVLAATELALLHELAEGTLLAVTPKDLARASSELGIVTLSNRAPSPLAAQLIESIKDKVGRYSLPPRRKL